MGVEGTWEYFSNLINKHKKKKKQMQTVSLKVRMDCEGCGRKMKQIMSRVKGAKKVDVDVKQMKVTVTGYIEPKKVLKAAQATKKKVEMWPYVPVSLEPYPYISASYDKKAPPNMVRSVPNTASITETLVNENYVRMFSDDNPYACSIM
ncbi:unnamed protein product [Citrullus colocynthis]|uniref:HMA domain-containing protein n=1 Tax=Citrullus colocynthis TaxID=252529 RepID=A0ABP0ZA00_9ROSI